MHRAAFSFSQRGPSLGEDAWGEPGPIDGCVAPASSREGDRKRCFTRVRARRFVEKYLKRSLAVRVLWAADGCCVLSRVDLGGFAIHQPASGFHTAAGKRIAEPVNKQDRRKLWQARLRGAKQGKPEVRPEPTSRVAGSVCVFLHSLHSLSVKSQKDLSTARSRTTTQGYPGR